MLSPGADAMPRAVNGPVGGCAAASPFPLPFPMAPPPVKRTTAAAAAAATATQMGAVQVGPAAPPSSAPAFSREDEAPEMPEDAEVAGGAAAMAVDADAEMHAAALSEEDGEEGVSPQEVEQEVAAARRVSAGSPADATLT